MKTVMEITVIQELDEENIKAHEEMSKEEVEQMFKVWEEKTLRMLKDEIDGDFTMKFNAYVKE